MNNTEFQTSRLLRLLGISHRGFMYYKVAVQMILRDNPNNLTCGLLYRYVAEQCNSTSHAVKASMRYSLDCAYKEGSLSLLNELYKGDVIRDFKPNLIEVLYLIVDYLNSL